jgi:hypothetical protein
MLSDLGREKDLDDDTYLEHLTDVFNKPIDGYTLDVALHGCRFEPDAKDRKVIRRVLEKTSPERAAYV